MNEFKTFGIIVNDKSFVGPKLPVDDILNCEIIVEAFKLGDSKFKGDCLTLQIQFNNKSHVVFTSGSRLIEVIKQVPTEKFPFKTTIIKVNKVFKFT